MPGIQRLAFYIFFVSFSLTFFCLIFFDHGFLISLACASLTGVITSGALAFIFQHQVYRPLNRFRNHLYTAIGEREKSDQLLLDMEAALQELKESHKKEVAQLKEIETFRREFLGNVSHELKTPIFAIQGFIDTLLDGAMDDPQVNKDFLEKASKHADRLDNLVKDLLIISQLETGQLQMSMEDFRIYDLVLEVFEALEYKLTRKGRSVRLKLVSNEFDNILVHADRERIRQVLTNLVDNAIKYGLSSGLVTVQIRLKSAKKAVVFVSNEGKGIEAEHLPRLFERFYRVDKSRSREKGGTGLGLAIAKHLIEAHREKISVESDMEKGSIFTFTLTRAD